LVVLVVLPELLVPVELGEELPEGRDPLVEPPVLPPLCGSEPVEGVVGLPPVDVAPGCVGYEPPLSVGLKPVF
jgi:hypothetical protein